MAWKIEEAEDGTFDWSVALSAYGAAVGNAPTREAAEDELLKAQGELLAGY